MSTFLKAVNPGKVIIAFLFIFTITAIVPSKSLAYMATTNDFGSNAAQSQSFDRQSDADRISKVLSTEAVRDKLSSIGLSEQDINDRINSLSDEELNHFASSLEGAQQGSGVLGLVIGILIVVALVLLILHLTGNEVGITVR